MHLINAQIEFVHFIICYDVDLLETTEPVGVWGASSPGKKFEIDYRYLQFVFK